MQGSITYRQAVDFMRKTAGAPVASVTSKGGPTENKNSRPRSKQPGMWDRLLKSTPFYNPYKGATPTGKRSKALINSNAPAKKKKWDDKSNMGMRSDLLK